MFNISQFFEKAERRGLAQVLYVEGVAKIIGKHLGVEIPITSISVSKNAVMNVKAHPSVKNGLFMKKEGILKEIREAFPGTPLADIR